MRFSLLLVVVFDIFIIVQITHAATQPAPLSGAQVKAVLSGNSMAGNGKGAEPSQPYDWQVHYATDGTMMIRLKPAWGGAEDVGKWWVSSQGELCRQFKQMAFGKKGCWLVSRQGEFLRLTPASGVAVNSLGIVLPGNILQNNK